MANPALTFGRSHSFDRLWDSLVACDRTHPQFADAVLACALAAVTVPWVVLHTSGRPAWWICSFALVVPLVWRRRYPVGVLIVLAGVALAQWITAGPLLADAALLAALFTIALERPAKTALAAGALVEVGVVMASVRWAFADSWDRSLIGLTGLAAVAVLAGVVLRTRRARLAELTERAARLELERDQQAQIAAAAERTRIAREMHDVIAHSLAVIVTMADAAKAKLARDPPTATEAISSISDVSRQALADTRRLLGVLRDNADADLSPQPGLAGIDDLVHTLRSAGLDASVSYSGHLFPLAPGAELTLYRIVQEAATNTLKHAGQASLFDVRLTFTDPAVRVDIADDGRQQPATDDASRGGHGLAGMRERAALYHGHVDAGPRPGQGWFVRATLRQAGGDAR